MNGRPAAHLVTVLVLLVGCDERSSTSTAGAPRETPKNVVLVVGDALRARNLPLYGYDKPTAPFLSSLADRGLLYENAYSHYSSTWATFSNLFTGRPYSALVAEGLFTAQSRQSRSGGLEEANETLAELLRSVGVRSRGVSANPYLAKEHGFAQGFEAFHDWSDWDPDFWSAVRKFRAADVNRVAFRYLDELAAQEGPWLLFLLYFETHNPYQAGPEHRAGLVDAAYARSDRNRGGGPRDRDGEPLKYLTPELEDWYTAEDVAHLVSLYDAEIRAFDDGVRDLVAQLEDRGLWKDTVLIVTADHGESLFERGYWGHGFLSRDEVQHTPLLVVNSGATPRRLSGVTGSSDIFHSLLAHFGVRSAAANRVPWAMSVLDGAQKGSVMHSEGPGDTTIVRDSRYSWYLHRGVEDRFPLPARNGEYLFDRLEDPGETENLLEHPGRRAEAALTRDRLVGDLAPASLRKPPAEDPFLQGDDERLERLRALGYVR